MLEKKAFTIYNASAGAGKTHTLVKEYLKILLGYSNKDDAYRNILAITFTNKAVNEMKSRIVSCIYAFTLNEIPAKEYQLLEQIVAETTFTEAYIREKSKKILKNIIHNYAGFDISTIDKFTHKVIRSFAFDLNLPFHFEVSLDTEALLQEAVDALIAQAGVNEELTKLLVDFSISKADDDKSWDISRELMEIGRLLLNENNKQELEAFENIDMQTFLSLKTWLHHQIDQLSNQTVLLATEALQLLETNGINLKSFSRGTFPNYLQRISNRDFTNVNKEFSQPEHISINKTAKDKDAIEQLIPDLLAITKKIYPLFGKIYFYEAFLKNLVPLSLLNFISNEINRIQNEQQILSISQFNKIIYEELKNQPAPFIYERLGEKYRHFFIDEFQDTSEMQWQNLVPLIDNALSGADDYGKEGSLMIVGDPKQAIYRWRGGKAEQFMQLSDGENPFSNPSKATVSLDTNYRSFSEVIEFNNCIFKFLANQFNNGAYQNLYENYSHQNTTSKKGGFVKISFLDQNLLSEENEVTKTDLYLDEVLKTINSVLQQGFSLSDIVVLTRKSKNGVEVANHLTKNGIRILSSETLLINNATEVQLLLNLLRFLKNNHDKEAKALILYYVGRFILKDAKVHDVIVKGMAMDNETDFQNYLKTFGIEINFKELRKNNLYVAVELMVSAFLPSKKTEAYVQYFLDLILERTVKNQSTVADFLNYWEQNYHKLSIPSPENENAVRLMTVHKAKGLEFPVVIYPFADDDFSRSRDKIWVDLEENEQLVIPKALVDLKNDVKMYGATAQRLYEQKKQEELLDNLNVLYVALTRAEEQLYIISNYKRNKDGTLANTLARFFVTFLEDSGRLSENELHYPFGNPAKVSAQKKHQEKPIIIQSVEKPITSSVIKIAKREAIMWDTKQQQAIEKGNLIHELLSEIFTADDIDFVIQRAVSKGMIPATATDEIRETIEKIVFHEALQPFFNKEYIIYNERTILHQSYKNSKPDRVAINGKKAYIIDYKTGEEQSKYAQQVNEYALAIEEMGYEIAKKVVLYIQDDLKIIHL
ncbi:UvrD-helicase domain-containing protein [Flavobacterium sp. CBA20B-1]|uniref:UvrD-helicase domain-containing protein n=1 Tax=unclassified Flavobacterium TaxID=196869 RepID=UPI0022244377|nr:MULTISPECIES: UvrD-helicase domain-containing protein [unclassified Flavobacterium]WCM43493.1 UvrD-helicase domain-containing protein [Flavobacterium sp. CBA20B-1]